MADNKELENSSQMETEVSTTSTQSTSGGSRGSTALPKMLTLLTVILAIGVGLVFWKTNVIAHHGEGKESLSLSKEEMELLVKDFPVAQRKSLSDSPEQKTKLVDNLKEMLAVSSQAKKEGYDQKPQIHEMVKTMKKSLYAMGYDKKINADKGPMPPFGYIGEDRVKEFWGEGKDMSGLKWIWNGAESRRREADFRAFIDPQIKMAQELGQIPKGQEPSEDQINQAKDSFAKTDIYYKEVMDKLAGIDSLPEEEQKEWKEWKQQTDLQVKLQNASFVSQNYTKEVLTPKFVVTDEEVKEYIAKNPDLNNTDEKEKEANEILQKVKDGGDFAELAKEYSDDPGSKNKGGLYEGIGMGQFAPEFEKTVMALEPGEVADEVVKTAFGFHIIKLEKKGEAKGADGKTKPTYDARHILLSTMVKDPDNPMAREMPVEQYVKAKLSKTKQETIKKQIIDNNPVEVAEDFEIPEVTDEELKEDRERQMKQMQEIQKQKGQTPGQNPPSPPKPVAKKPAPKKEASKTEKK